VLFPISSDMLLAAVTGYYDIAAAYLMRRLARADAEAGDVQPSIRRLVLVQNWFEESREKLGQ